MPADKKSLLNIILIALLLLLIFLLQYTFRFADDNRLTSWQWTFANFNPVRFILLLILGTIPAFLLSIFPFYKSRAALFLFIFSFAVSAVFWSVPEVIVDTARYFTQAKHLEIYGIQYFFRQWGKEISAWTDLPLVSFFYGVIFRFFGESRTYVQIFTTFMFSMTIVLTYLTGKTLWDEETGFLAGALLMGIPYLFSQVPLMLADIPTMFFLTLSIFTFCKAMENGGVWIVYASFALFFAIFSKYSTWMLLSVLPVIFVVYIINCRGNPLWLPSSRAGTGACPYMRRLVFRAIPVVFIAGILVAIVILLKHDVIAQQMIFLREYQAPGLKRWGESFVSTFLFQIHPFITLAALYSVYEAVRKRDVKFAVVCWLILLAVLFQIKRARYIMGIFPMLTLMASYGLQKIGDAGLRKFIVFGIIASSLAVAIFSYLPFLQKNSMVNIKDPGKFLNSVRPESIRVFTIPSSDTIVNLAVSVPILDLHTDKEIYYRDDATYSPPSEGIKTSPLRFTWEYKNPQYYLTPLKKGGTRGFSEKNEALVVISNGHLKSLPDNIAEEVKGYRKVRAFDTSEGIFGFNPVVTVYLPDK